MSRLGADDFAIPAVFGVLLVGIVLPLAIIDLKTMLLPDRLNLLLAGAGIAQSAVLGAPDPIDAVLGALAAGVCLTLVMTLYRQLRGFDGLGLGDVKFITAAGIWIGWQGLPLMLFVASTSALLVLAARAFKDRKLDRLAPLPFGPLSWTRHSNCLGRNGRNMSMSAKSVDTRYYHRLMHQNRDA